MLGRALLSGATNVRVVHAQQTTVCSLSDCFFSLPYYYCSGRRVTPQGQRDLDRIAGQVAAQRRKAVA